MTSESLAKYDKKIAEITEQINALVVKIKPGTDGGPIIFVYENFAKGRVMVNGQKNVAGEVIKSGKHIGLSRELGELSAVKEILRIIKAKFVPEMDSPMDNFVKYENNLLQFCKAKDCEPHFSSELVEEKYNVTLTVGSLVSYSGPTKLIHNARGIAAMNWLWLYGENWQQVLDQQSIGNQIFASRDPTCEIQGKHIASFNLDEQNDNLNNLINNNEKIIKNEDVYMSMSQEVSDPIIDVSLPDTTASFKFSNTAIQDYTETAVPFKPKSRKVRKLNKPKASNIFEYTEDPDIIDILKKQKEVKNVALKAKKGTKLAKGVQKMLVSNKNIAKSVRPSRKQPKRLSKKCKSPIKKNEKVNLQHYKKKLTRADKSSDVEEDVENDLNEYIPDLDEILKLPSQPDDGSKSKEQLLDEMDKLIAERQRQHEQEMEEVDADIEAMKKRGRDRKLRLKDNAKLRNRLETELTEPLLRKMFQSNVEYLKGIWNGKVESSRHVAYHKSIKSRHAIYYTMITDPFTDNQIDWTLDEIGKIWMRTRKETMDNKEYIWKVILAECFIKFYSDFFNFSKEESMKRISETPLHKADRLKEFMNSSDDTSGSDEG